MTGHRDGRPPSRFDYSPIVRRPPLGLPGGARVAVWVGLNIEHYEPGRPALSISQATAAFTPDPLNAGWREYGPRVGLWRIADVLDRHGVRASALLNSDVCELYPEIIEEGVERDWAWLAHGKNNSTVEAEMEVEEERRYLAEVVGTIARHTGHEPRGWLGPFLSESFATPDLLAELGVTYVCDWCNDDQPHPMRVERGRMISLPYSIEANDVRLFLEMGVSGPDYHRVLVDQFDVLYESGAGSAQVMAIPLHPFLAGLPFRVKYLDSALAHIAAREDVWLATSDEIADWYYERYYDDAISSSSPSKRSPTADGVRSERSP